jgi:hypothetical protein
MTLEEINPAITVNVEIVKLLLKYFVQIYATIRLTIRPTKPESSKFLSSEMWRRTSHKIFQDNLLFY